MIYKKSMAATKSLFLLLLTTALNHAIAFAEANTSDATKTTECTIDATGNEVCTEVTKEDENKEAPSLSSSCKDTDDRCAFWASKGECENNPSYMLNACAKSCDSCAKYIPDPDAEAAIQAYGEPQTIDGNQALQTLQVVRDTIEYMKTVGDTVPEDVIKVCKNRNELCAFWAAIGECEVNPAFMVVKCAPSCKSCHLVDFDTRCGPRDPALEPALRPGDLDQMFERIVENDELSVTVHSRPEKGKGSDYDQPPWVITIDDFLTPEECDKIIEQGHKEGYKRSEDVGAKDFDGTYGSIKSEGRTSENAWCTEESGCGDDATVQQVLNRIEAVLNIPQINYEPFQILKYEEGQFYRKHHDFIEHQVKRQTGPRILTFFQYLSDVEEGGGTGFPKLEIKVMPKKGRVLLWPSVLNRNPEEKDTRMDHEALPVIKGVKFAANAWVHLYDNKTPHKKGCD